MKKITLMALGFLVLSATAAAVPGDPTLTVSPDPSAQGQYLTFAGCGYQRNKHVQLWVYSGEEAIGGFIAFAEADGCFSLEPGFAPAAGTYTVTSDSRHGNAEPLATTEFTVA